MVQPPRPWTSARLTVTRMTAAARPSRPADRPVARLTSPGEIAAVVPVLCGFVPTESLVVVALHGPRKRIGLTMRFDLDWAVVDLRAAAAEIVERLRLDGAARVVLVVFSALPDEASDRGRVGLVLTDLVDDVRDACRDRRIAVDEALLVRDGRWWSYVCSNDVCCPPEGTRLAEQPTPALQLVEVERVLGGRAVLESREQLRASVAAPVLLTAAACRQQLEAAAEQWWDRHHRDGRQALSAQGVAATRTLLSRVEAGGTVTGHEAAALAVAVQDVLVRDEVATWCLRRHEVLLSVLVQTARQVVPPQDAAVLALLGWVAYAHGDGGLANVAPERCLASDPDYSLAHLLVEMLARQVPPREVRTLMKATRRALRP